MKTMKNRCRYCFNFSFFLGWVSIVVCATCLLLHCQGVLAGRGSTPVTAASAVAGVGTRVGSLELKVEFHEEAILEVKRQAAAAETVEKRVQDVEILLDGLLNDLQTISLEAECAVNWAEEGSAAELDRVCSGFLGDFALLKEWVGEATFVQSDTEALRVLAGRATNLEQWG